MPCWLSRQTSIPRAEAPDPGVRLPPRPGLLPSDLLQEVLLQWDPHRRGLPLLPIVLPGALHRRGLHLRHIVLPGDLHRRGLHLRHTALHRTITGAAHLLPEAALPRTGVLQPRAGVLRPSPEVLPARAAALRLHLTALRRTTTAAVLLLQGAVPPSREVQLLNREAALPRAGVQQARTGAPRPGSQGLSATLPPEVLHPAVPTPEVLANRTRG